MRPRAELRANPDDLRQILVPTPYGAQVALGELASLSQVAGPQSIRSEDSFPVAYVLFDRDPAIDELTVVERAREHLAERIASGELELPPGVRYRFAGQFENQVRAAATLRIVLPVALAVIFLLLYLQFREVASALIVFSGVFVAWAGASC